MTKPIIVQGRIIWPWRMTAEERKVERGRLRAEQLNITQLDRVLEERAVRTKAARRQRAA